MDKYKVGDKFVIEITNVDGTGMGTVYTVNDSVNMVEIELDKFAPLSNEEDVKENKSEKTHTPTDLMDRIMLLTTLLTQTISVYEEVTGKTDATCNMVDSSIKDLGL